MKFYIFLLLFFIANSSFSQDYSYQDSISGHQTCVAFCSINDGHPGPPNKPFFQSNIGHNIDDVTTINLCVSNTFASNGFFRKSLFSLNFLNAEFQDNSIEILKSVGASWQQTWMYEKNNKPTISTLISIQYPYNEPNEVTEIQSVLIVNKNIGNSGVGYFNAFFNTPVNSPVSYSLLAGYKTFIDENKNLFWDIIYDSNDIVTLELSLEINLPKGSVISPGVNYQRDISNKSHIIGLGLVFLYQTL